jgi:hypothetical protein
LDHSARKTGKLHCGAGGDRAGWQVTTRNRRMRPIALCAVFAIVLACACSRTPDEQRIRTAIEAMQQAAEQRNPRGFMAYVSDDFVGNDADFDRNALANLLRVQVFHNDQVGVTLGPIEIELQDGRATAHVMATLTGGSGGLLPESGAIYSITSSWKRNGRDWICYSARWQQKL